MNNISGNNEQHLLITFLVADTVLKFQVLLLFPFGRWEYFGIEFKEFV